MMYSIQQIREGLEKAGYVANDEITTALWASVSRGRPLLLEGAAGSLRDKEEDLAETMRNLQLKSRDVPIANLQKYCGRCQPLASIQTIVSH